MNLQMSIERISDSIRQLISSEPTVRRRYEQGEGLEQILSCSKWAATWQQSTDLAQVEVLTRILLRFAGLPFELEGLMKTGTVRHFLTGAEIRVAVARLRRSGILFAMRKAWGEQLIYLPADTFAMWQPLLLPVEYEALPEKDMREVSQSGKDFRLPLSLELLIAWHTIYRQPIAFTAKGALHRPAIARMAAKMRLIQRELDCLALTYPQSEQIPAQVALALDIGLHCGILCEKGNEIRISDCILETWLVLSPIEADLRLHELIMTRYGSVDPSLHLTASAVQSLPTMKWVMDESIKVMGEQEGKVDQWLDLMESFGWVDRGMYKGRPVFRKKDRLDPRLQSVPMRSETIFVQPDGEIFVPPETVLEQRWMLEEIAERVTADHLFVYRLTRDASIRAFNSGHSVQSVVAFLERNSGTSLPEPCLRALQDWFAPLIGIPPLEQIRRGPASSKAAEATATGAATDRLSKKEQGWIYRSHALSVYEADRTIPNKDELFPGMSSIPASWISQPRTYHKTTHKEIIHRAINWQAAVQIGQNSGQHSFTPVRLEEEDSSWRVYGQWLTEKGIVSVQADDIREIMILLPPLQELESI
ncbi:helicase-associated domain-containing protein [Cohnella sp.]|uniref:helicase-associated domain-containing protein n=1 Tax=Cohnella sp. TaxID=1883426 RepID=UPI003569C63E